RRLRLEAVQDGGSHREASRIDPARQRTHAAGADVRRADARSAAGESHRGGHAGEAHEPRISRVVISDAPSRASGLAARVDRAHLRAERRPRLEHGGGVRCTAAAQAGRVVHRNGAGPRLSDDGEGRVTRPTSLRTRFLIGSVLWTAGLLPAAHLFSLVVLRRVPPLMNGQHAGVVLLLAVALMTAGFVIVRSGFATVNALTAPLPPLHNRRHPPLAAP